MTRIINLHAHDLDQAAFESLVHSIEQAVATARAAPGGTTVGGNIFDSHSSPQNRTL